MGCLELADWFSFGFPMPLSSALHRFLFNALNVKPFTLEVLFFLGERYDKSCEAAEAVVGPPEAEGEGDPDPDKESSRSVPSGCCWVGEGADVSTIRRGAGGDRADRPVQCNTCRWRDG